MDHSDCSEQTLDDFSILYTSPNVGSAYKRICFQSSLPFSPLVPWLKYIMVQLMMKGWFCSSGRRGEENEGGIAEAFSAALQEDHYSVERDSRRCFTLRVLEHTHTHVPFSFSSDANGLKHRSSSCSILITQILLNLIQSVAVCSDCILCWSVTSLSAAGFLTCLNTKISSHMMICVSIPDEHWRTCA